MDKIVLDYLKDVVLHRDYQEMLRLMESLLPWNAIANYVYAYTDDLTRFPNYRAFLRDTSEIRKKSVPIDIFVCDILALKLANDLYGHENGDNMVKLAVNILQKALIDAYPASQAYYRRTSYRQYGDDLVGWAVADNSQKDITETIRQYCRAINSARGNKKLEADYKEPVNNGILEDARKMLEIYPLDREVPFWVSVGVKQYSSTGMSFYETIQAARDACKEQKKYMHRKFPLLNIRTNGNGYAE